MQQTTRDFIYLIFLVIHLPATLLVDSQALFFAKRISPPTLRVIFNFASKDDYLLQNATNPMLSWFQSFIILEILFQVPVFVLGIRGLLRKKTSIQPLLAIYGASSSTTTWACLATVLNDPHLNTRQQRLTLFFTYLPFLLIPLSMALDYTIRLTKVCRQIDERGWVAIGQGRKKE